MEFIDYEVKDDVILKDKYLNSVRRIDDSTYHIGLEMMIIKKYKKKHPNLETVLKLKWGNQNIKWPLILEDHEKAKHFYNRNHRLTINYGTKNFIINGIEFVDIKRHNKGSTYKFVELGGMTLKVTNKMRRYDIKVSLTIRKKKWWEKLKL